MLLFVNTPFNVPSPWFERERKRTVVVEWAKSEWTERAVLNTTKQLSSKAQKNTPTPPPNMLSALLWVCSSALPLLKLTHRPAAHYTSMVDLQQRRDPTSLLACWLGSTHPLPKGWRPETSQRQQNSKKIQKEGWVSADTDTTTHF